MEREVWRPICEGTTLRLRLRTPSANVITTVSRSEAGLIDLVAATRVPDWRQGWTKFARDGTLSDVLAFYFDRILVYIARSAFLNCTAAIGMAYGVDCTFQYGSWISELLVARAAPWAGPSGDTTRVIEPCQSRAIDSRNGSPRRRYCAAIAGGLNALDPHLHRMLYCYVRALRLLNEGFWEDSVSSLDAAVRIATDLVRDRMRNPAGNAHEAMIRQLRVGSRTDASLGELRALRNYFGAHPGEAGFWDFPDDRGDDVLVMFESVEQLVWAAARFERAHRHVHPIDGGDWSDWFRTHAHLLSNIVWFRLATPAPEPLSSSRPRKRSQ
ncbi:MAG: hypothetical protein JO168_07030 [Solirubrobacterales bacterium]|nr:hypothetical protein [Solirubrobacterales bacterium]